MAEDLHVVGMDVSQVDESIRRLTSIFNQYSSELQRVTRAQIQFSKSGDVMAATLNGITKANREFSVNMKASNGELRVASASIGEMQRRTADARKSMVEDLGSILLSWRNLARFGLFRILSVGVYGFINSLREAITAAREFQIHISEIRTISQDSQLSFGQWADSVRRLSDEFGKPIADVAEATYETISNQIAKGAEATEFLTQALKFAQATVSTTEQSVNLLSSAINSFQLQATEAERVAAVFFKVIDLGRVRAGEMANTFGRIGPTAHALGITLEEAGAAVSTLTINGVKYNEAFTQISNLMTALLKPTTEMKNLFKEWGVETGEAAIQTFGFAETLRKIERAAGGSSTEIAKLFPNVRGLRGAIALTASSFNNYDSILNKISQDSLPQYRKASEIAMESAGKQLEIELNKVKNLFIYDFGNPAIDTILKVSKALGGEDGMAGAIRRITNLIITGATIFIGYKLVNKINDLTHAFLEMRATGGSAWASLKSGIMANVTAINYVQVALAAVIALYHEQRMLERELESARDDALDKIKERYRQEREAAADAMQQQTEAVTRAIKQQFQLRLQNVASARKIIDAMLDDQKKVAAAQKSVIELAFKTQTDALEANLNRLRDAYTTTLGNIKEAARILNELRDRQADRGFEIDLEFAKPEERVKVITDRISALRKEFSGLLNSTGDAAKDEENLKRAKERANEIGNLLKNLARERNDIEGRRVELVERIAELEAKAAANRNLDIQRQQLQGAGAEEQRLRALEREARRRGDVSDLTLRREALSRARREGVTALGAARDAEADRREADELNDAKAKLALLTAQSRVLPDLTRLKTELSSLDRQMADNLEKFIKAQERSVQIRKQDIDLQQKQIDALKQTFQAILSFKLPSVTTQADKTTALGQFDALLKQAEGTGGLRDQQTILELQKYRIELSKQADLEIQKHTLATQAQTYDQLQKDLEQQRKQIDADTQTNIKRAQTAVDQIEALTKELKVAADVYTSGGTSQRLSKSIQSIYEQIGLIRVEGPNRRNQQELSNRFANAVYELTVAATAFSLTPKKLSPDQSTSTLGRYHARRVLISEAEGTKPARTLQDTQNDFTSQLSQMTAAMAENVRLQKALGLVGQSEKAAGVSVQDVKKNFDNISSVLSKYGSDFGIEVNKTTEALRQLDSAVRSSANIIRGLPPVAPPGRPGAIGPTSFNTANNFGGISVTVNSTGNAATDGRAIAEALNQELRRGTVVLQTGRNA